MARPRKKVERAHFFQRVSQLLQALAVAGGGSCVAGDHHDTLRLHSRASGERSVVAALSRWVEDYHVRTLPGAFKLLCSLSCVGADELRITYGIALSVPSGVFNRKA